MQDLLNYMQNIDCKNHMMYGEDIMWKPIIKLCEEYIDNGNKFKGASRYSSTNLLLTGYIDKHGDRVFPWRRR